MKQNKTGKYFKYAIGEIVLVVIGILIAVWINSKYSDLQNEKKIQAILVQVQKEILTDINEAKRIFGVYIHSDSLARNIRNDKVTIEVFKNNPRTVLFKNRVVSFSNKKTGYERFMNNLENLPKKYHVLLPYFNELFRELQHTIDYRNQDIFDFGRAAKRINSKTIPNWYLGVDDLPEEDIKTVLNNPYLKNNVLDHIILLSSVCVVANEYRVLSVELYKKIDSLLGTQPSSYPNLLSTIPKQEVLKDLLGEYTEVENKKPSTLTLSLNGNHIELITDSKLFGKGKGLSENPKILWNSDEYYFMDQSFPYFVFKQFKNQKRQQVWEVTNGMNKKVFIKTSDLYL